MARGKPAPITDADVHAAVSILERYPNGLTREDLKQFFGGDDRRAREILSEIAARGLAPVASPQVTPNQTYRLAQTEEERQAEARMLRSRAERLLERARGVESAPLGRTRVPQGSLFGDAA